MRESLVFPVVVPGIFEGVVAVGVAVCPAIYRDGLDVPCRIESALGQGGCELVANVSLDGLKRSGKQLVATEAPLRTFPETFTRTMRKAFHVHDNWVIGITRELVTAHGDGKIEHCVHVVAAR